MGCRAHRSPTSWPTERTASCRNCLNKSPGTVNNGSQPTARRGRHAVIDTTVQTSITWRMNAACKVLRNAVDEERNTALGPKRRLGATCSRRERAARALVLDVNGTAVRTGGRWFNRLVEIRRVVRDRPADSVNLTEENSRSPGAAGQYVVGNSNSSDQKRIKGLTTHRFGERGIVREFHRHLPLSGERVPARRTRKRQPGTSIKAIDDHLWRIKFKRASPAVAVGERLVGSAADAAIETSKVTKPALSGQT